MMSTAPRIAYQDRGAGWLRDSKRVLSRMYLSRTSTAAGLVLQDAGRGRQRFQQIRKLNDEKALGLAIQSGAA